ncbi:MAG: CPBP family intramembrane metalloprotease [Hyphomicrobiaceae bacterium]|nr:CPBP family intramembrane metalloprotease [Hyphomicrobiaceae bacterium]
MRSLRAYFILVTLLTIPVWILGLAVDLELLPGLPIGAVAVICPALAAGILSYREGGWKSVLALLSRLLDFGRAKWWLLAIALVNPLLFDLAFLVARGFLNPVPDPEISITHALVLLALFLPAAALEEIGWTGFAFDRLRTRFGLLSSGLLLGLFWALWHFPTLIAAGRAPGWIVWWTVWTVSARLIMVTAYDWAGRSLFAMVLYHAMSNLCWQLYPVNGSFFDPQISGMLTAFAALCLLAAAYSKRHVSAPRQP